MLTLCNMQISSKAQLMQMAIPQVPQIFDYILQVFQVCLTWVESADRRCAVLLKLAGGGAASTGGRTLGGAVASSLLVTSENRKPNRSVTLMVSSKVWLTVVVLLIISRLYLNNIIISVHKVRTKWIVFTCCNDFHGSTFFIWIFDSVPWLNILRHQLGL